MDFITSIYDTNIDLDATFFCGQTFFWKRVDEGFLGCVNGEPAIVNARGGKLIVRACGGDWERYFDVSRDYDAIAAKFSGDSYISRAHESFSGMRVLNQPVWETLCGFIISANNNIKRITSIIERLSSELGEERGIGPYRIYSFPSPAAIAKAGEPKLRELGLGYRASYLYDTASRISDNYDLDSLKSMGYMNALKELTRFKGVGEKVADCVLLFSCEYREAFPVDVWMLKVMKALYNIEGSAHEVKKAGMEMFGEEAGFIQQLLFHGGRMGLFDR